MYIIHILSGLDHVIIFPKIQRHRVIDFRRVGNKSIIGTVVNKNVNMQSTPLKIFRLSEKCKISICSSFQIQLGAEVLLELARSP